MKNKIVTKTDVNYVDLSTMVEFSSGNGKGCLTIVENGKNPRLRLSPDLYEDLGKPAAVRTGFVGDHLVLIPSTCEGKATDVKPHHYLYNVELARKVMAIAGIVSTGKDSKPVGSYHLQSDATGNTVAVVTLVSASTDQAA